MNFFEPKRQFKKVGGRSESVCVCVLVLLNRTFTSCPHLPFQVIQTDGFTCIEMQEGRPWSFQTDLFCVAGTIHVMLFGEYMQLVKKYDCGWDIKQKLPRYAHGF